jgi:hypothetical protein
MSHMTELEKEVLDIVLNYKNVYMLDKRQVFLFRQNIRAYRSMIL